MEKQNQNVVADVPQPLLNLSLKKEQKKKKNGIKYIFN